MRHSRPSARILLIAVLSLGAGCLPVSGPSPEAPIPSATAPETSATSLPARTVFAPGELVPYLAKSGDTLPAIAAHFNTTLEELREANPDLPATVTTLPKGFPLQVPAYYSPLTGKPFQILPDSEFIAGPSAIGFDLRREIQRRPGFLATLSDYAYERERPAWEVVEVVSRNYSLHPRMLLALLEHQSHALSKPVATETDRSYPLGYADPRWRGLFRQLVWAAERLSDGYYGWRAGTLREIESADGLLVHPDPWQNSGTVGLQLLFAGIYEKTGFDLAVSPDGFQRSYHALWGDPFQYESDLFPANLQQPPLALPFSLGQIWDFTGGPHFSWGTSLPLGALDFAPPAVEGGCATSMVWIAAPAPGVITRSEEATVILDLDGDGDDRTGWSLFFFHVAAQDRVVVGKSVEQGDLLGHPSCEGGRSTGTHFHLARRYNGEWLPAGGPMPFALDGWVAREGSEPYQGTLTKGSKVVLACTCSTAENRILYEFP